MTHLAGYAEFCGDGLERLLNQPAGTDDLSQRIYEEIDEVWQILVDAMPTIENALSAGREGDAGEACCGALARVFDWEEGGHNRCTSTFALERNWRTAYSARKGRSSSRPFANA